MASLTDRIKQANTLLSPLATPHEGRLGRPVEEPGDLTRFPFERDRHRIIRSAAFRRLQGKTQVFTAGEGDFFRTRLTHTMEVAQMARALARALQLNEDLAECIALAHDIGHPPFGHTGEEAINRWMAEQGRAFEHNQQSHRIVTVLEVTSSQYQGLNLNREVEEALLKHETMHPTHGTLLETSLEASVTDLADELAYSAHDIDDALSAGLFHIEELMEMPFMREAYADSKERGTPLNASVLHLLAEDVIAASGDLRGGIRVSADVRTALNDLRSFFWAHIYSHPRVHDATHEGAAIVEALCQSFAEHPHEKITALEQRTGSDRITAVKDYVAGMTDWFARLQAAERGIITR